METVQQSNYPKNFKIPSAYKIAKNTYLYEDSLAK